MIDLAQLDDAPAQRILTTIARVRARDLPEDSPHLRAALADEFQLVPSDASVSAGELARQALMVLAEGPATRLAIDSLAREEESATLRTFDGGATIALGLAVYFALSTALDFERDKQGNWSFKVKVKPASEAAVKKLVEKLIGYVPG